MVSYSPKGERRCLTFSQLKQNVQALSEAFRLSLPEGNIAILSDCLLYTSFYQRSLEHIVMTLTKEDPVWTELDVLAPLDRCRCLDVPNALRVPY